MEKNIIILGIESSCDDTSAAVVRGDCLLSNVIASQAVHSAYGGVVPELASRAHLQNIVPVVSEAVRRAELIPEDIDAIAFTRGPGLLGSLLVGAGFAKGLSLALCKPLVEVNHLHAHVLAHFLQTPEDNVVKTPDFPFLCLLVSGGNSQLIVVHSPSEMQVVGQTIDDAAGEAFDKCAKMMGLAYPGGPIVSKLAQEGDEKAFRFAKPRVSGLDYSFSGLKTSFLYTLRDHLKENPAFVEERKADLCASLQRTIVEILMEKLRLAAHRYGMARLALAGGVSANSALRDALLREQCRGFEVFIPKPAYTTDNAAMVAMAGYFKYIKGEFCALDAPPFAGTVI